MTPISHILCPIDFSDGSRHAVRRAAAVARASNAGVTILHVFVNRPVMDLPPVTLQHADRERLLEDMRQFSHSAAPGLRADFRLCEGDSAYEGILGAVDDVDPDLLVMGTHGRTGFRRLFLGSVTEKVVRTAPCPTLVVPPHAGAIDVTPGFQRILCAVDLSEASLAALARALQLAQQENGHLLIVYVAEIPLAPPELPPGMDLSAVAARSESEVRQRLEALIPVSARQSCSIETSIVHARAYREILRLAAERHADVIVMGVHGRGAVDLMLFGSTTHHVLRAAPCPVLIVHSEDGLAALRRFREQGEPGSCLKPPSPS